MTKLKKYEEDFILFAEAGFIAINQADEDSTLKLFKAAELLNPKNSLAKIGKGYLHLHKLELTNAIKSFEEVLKDEPKNEIAKTLLGIAKTFTAKEAVEGEKILTETTKSSDKMIKKLSGTALDFVNKFVKKDSGPLNIKKK